MRDGKKPRGIKHRIREEKKREERIGLAIFVVILIATISVSGFFIHSMLSSPPQKQETDSSSEPKAAIVDHLSLTFPNQTFVETATNTLEHAGYTVDYYPGEEVSVEFYRNLPTHGYRIIIFRVHSLARDVEGAEGLVALFTSNSFSRTEYVYEQLADQLRAVAYSVEEKQKGIAYFGMCPPFVTQAMKGRFENTTILVMGCEGLKNSAMAKAFVEKGAKVYLSWNEQVSASHTDLATTHLLLHLLIEKRTVKQAIQETYREVGADPAYKSLLIAYPTEALDYTIKAQYQTKSLT